MAAETLSYRHRGRSVLTLAIVLGVWFVLIAVYLLLDAAVWIVLLLGAFTLPAIWELFTNSNAGLDLTQDGIAWFTGKRSASAGWDEIERFRLDTRLDFSVRATAVLTSGRKIRLPFECIPEHKALEAALHARGIRTERHHFSLIG